VADITLAADELVTFRSESAREYDVVRKNWGYYATPSLAGRLRAFGFRSAIMRNKNTRHCFVVLVDVGHVAAWQSYMVAEDQELVMWLDDFEAFSAMPALDPASLADTPRRS
jgi:hypothetical protein